MFQIQERNLCGETPIPKPKTITIKLEINRKTSQ